MARSAPSRPAPAANPTTGMPRRTAVWRAALLVICLPAGISGEEPPAAARPTGAEPDRHPDLRRLSRTEEVWIDPQGRRVIIGGEVVIERGPIEVFACPRGTKEHEAIVATRSTAQLVHVGLLAIGLEPGHPVSFSPDYAAAEGPPVSVRVRWQDADGEPREVSARDWIRNTRTGAALDVDFVFAGSTFWTDPLDGKDYYQADGGDLICVSNFPTATLDLPIESSQSNEALLFEAFEGRVPPRGTRVELILSPLKPDPPAKPSAPGTSAPK
jgi:hypothetical protein